MDIQVPYKVVGRHVADDERVGREDRFDIDIDEIVERVEMLLDQPLDLEEGR